MGAAATETLISVIIPAYNYAHLLPRAIDSALAQAADDIELIVVNDGSQDNTAELLAEYASRHPGLRAINQENAGAAAARNRGIQEAHGRYALLLDADDELLPDALSHLRELIRQRPDAGMFLGAQISVFPDGNERIKPPTPVLAAPPHELVRRYLLQKRIAISHGCSLFRRDLLLQRPYPENLRKGEDIAVFAYLLISTPVVTTAHVLARIYKHPDSLRHNRQDEEDCALGMVEAVFSSLPDECQSLRRRYTAQRYLSLFRSAQNAEDRPAAKRFLYQALLLSPLQAMRWSYLRKGLRLMAGV